MDVQILHLIEGAKQAKGLTVIIDVFRAFTVETYLMRNHAKKIIPVGDVQTAFDYRAKHPDAILCGERKGIIIDGFDYGNSPSQVEHVDLTGKTVIHTTSAGTQGIVNASGADEIIGGSLVAAKAIARYIRSRDPEHVSLVCMGLAGKRQTDEDELCGLYIKSLLEDAPLEDLHQRIDQLRYTEGAKFFDPAQQAVFPERDFYLSTQVDSCDFVLRLTKDPESGLNCMERVDIV
ncbi:MAG: 2-phosphosulfolactate phosphatase [Oscillospiraceae bacterium]|nr:2-phosphosulfolactate phosphatase [Oscillospiraceae bacterium]